MVVASSGSRLQNWGCNASKPLWSSRLPLLIRSPHYSRNFQTWKIFITHHQLQSKQISDSQAFRPTQQKSECNPPTARYSQLMLVGWS